MLSPGRDSIGNIEYIDRFEGNYAIVEFEGRKMKDILKSELASGAQEGDDIVLVNGKYQVDQDEMQRRKTEIAKLTENMWEWLAAPPALPRTDPHARHIPHKDRNKQKGEPLSSPFNILITDAAVNLRRLFMLYLKV